MNLRQTLEPIIRRRGVNHCASLAGVNHTAISNWLAGRATIALATIEKLVDGLIDETAEDRKALQRVRRRMKKSWKGTS
jgi:hypothetical protein